MLFFNSTKLVIAGVLGAGVLTIIGLSYLHYSKVVTERDQLKANNAKLEMAIDYQNTTIQAQGEAIIKWSDAQKALLARVEEMDSVNTDAIQEMRRLNELFSQHNFDRLLSERPGLIESRINAGSSRINSLLECASGAASSDCTD